MYFKSASCALRSCADSFADSALLADSFADSALSMLIREAGVMGVMPAGGGLAPVEKLPVVVVVGLPKLLLLLLVWVLEPVGLYEVEDPKEDAVPPPVDVAVVVGAVPKLPGEYELEDADEDELPKLPEGGGAKPVADELPKLPAGGGAKSVVVEGGGGAPVMDGAVGGTGDKNPVGGMGAKLPAGGGAVTPTGSDGGSTPSDGSDGAGVTGMNDGAGAGAGGVTGVTPKPPVAGGTPKLPVLGVDTGVTPKPPEVVGVVPKPPEVVGVVPKPLEVVGVVPKPPVVGAGAKPVVVAGKGAGAEGVPDGIVEKPPDDWILARSEGLRADMGTATKVMPHGIPLMISVPRGLVPHGQFSVVFVAAYKAARSGGKNTT